MFQIKEFFKNLFNGNLFGRNNRNIEDSDRPEEDFGGGYAFNMEESNSSIDAEEGNEQSEMDKEPLELEPKDYLAIFIAAFQVLIPVILIIIAVFAIFIFLFVGGFK